MTEQGIRKLLFLIDNYGYSDWKPKSIDAMVTIWNMTLEEYSDETVNVALNQYFKTGSSYAPKVSDLIGIIKSAEDFGDLNEVEVSTLIVKALSNSIYNAQKEFDKLPLIAQKVVGSASQLEMWAKDENFNLEVVQSNIQRTYRNVLKQEQNYRRMSPNMQMLADSYRENKIMIDAPKETTPLLTTVIDDNCLVLDGETTSKYLEKLKEKLYG